MLRNMRSARREEGFPSCSISQEPKEEISSNGENNMKENDSNKSRLKDLAKAGFDNNRFTFTGFLSLAELSEYYDIKKELDYAYPVLWGGHELCERVMIRFGNPEILGFEEEFPIRILEISPVADKFADDLNHRDFLGALMNLGINRNTLGDIFVKNKKAYVFCKDTIAGFIIENLTRIKHTTIKVRQVTEAKELDNPEFEEKLIQVPSERADVIISKVWNLSRKVSTEMFPEGLVAVNGRITTENAKGIKAGESVSLRGYGKFIYDGLQGTSKKGKLNVKVRIYR